MERESLELAAARTAVNRAINDYVRQWVKERNEALDLMDTETVIVTEPYVDCWAVVTEVTSPELEQTGCSMTITIVPHEQARVTTLGLFHQMARDF